MPNSARTEEIRARVEKANAKTWPSIRHYEQASREFLDHARQDVPYLLTELTALREEVGRLKGVLEKYGGHHLDCEQLKLRGGSECSCGFEAALSPSPAQQEEK